MKKRRTAIVSCVLAAVIVAGALLGGVVTRGSSGAGDAEKATRAVAPPLATLTNSDIKLVPNILECQFVDSFGRPRIGTYVEWRLWYHPRLAEFIRYNETYGAYTYAGTGLSFSLSAVRTNSTDVPSVKQVFLDWAVLNRGLAATGPGTQFRYNVRLNGTNITSRGLIDRFDSFPESREDCPAIIRLATGGGPEGWKKPR